MVIRHYLWIMTLGLNCIDLHCRTYPYDSSLVEVGICSGFACAKMGIVETVCDGVVEVVFGYDGVANRVHQYVGSVGSEMERVVVVVVVVAVVNVAPAVVVVAVVETP